jgi:hypothetical protein
MKTIPLTNNKTAIVDDQDYSELSNYKWHCYQDPLSKIWYAKRTTPRMNGKQKTIGYYDTPEKASEIFNIKSKEIYGEFFNG